MVPEGFPLCCSDAVDPDLLPRQLLKNRKE